MSHTIVDIDGELDQIESKIRPLRQRAAELVRMRRKLESAAWIAENGVTRDKVQMSSGVGLPYFGTAIGFGRWLAGRADPKPFCEWNTTIYFTHDLLNGRLPDMPSKIDELAA